MPKPSRTPRTRWTVGAAVSGLVLLAAPAVAAHAAPTRSTLPGSVPSWAAAKSFVQPASATADVGFRMYLGWRNEDQLVASDQAVSTPGNANYRHFLSPAQFHQLYSQPSRR